MTIWIVQNGGGSRVVADLRRICGNDPGLVVDDFTGKVSFTPTTSSLGAMLLARLTRPGQIVPISIRVEAPTYMFFNTGPPGLPELLFCGRTVPTNQRGFVPHIEIFYDVSGGLTGLGYFVYDSNSRKIPVPTDVALFHELEHARIFLEGETDRRLDELDVIGAENDYRSSHGLPIRLDHFGGLYGDPDRTKAPHSISRFREGVSTVLFQGSSCYVAHTWETTLPPPLHSHPVRQCTWSTFITRRRIRSVK